MNGFKLLLILATAGLTSFACYGIISHANLEHVYAFVCSIILFCVISTACIRSATE